MMGWYKCPHDGGMCNNSGCKDGILCCLSDGEQEEDKHAARKATPLFSGCIAYFPDALMEIARLSKHCNDQHNPGERFEHRSSARHLA